MKLLQRGVLALTAALAGCGTTEPPQRDVFVPPYAEKGCWARLHEQAGYGAPVRELAGPAFVEAMRGAPVVVPDMSEAGAQPLFSEVKSLELGPHARLIGYAEPLFRGARLELEPGTRLEDVGTIGFHERVASFELRCQA